MECMILTILISTHSLTRRLTNTTYTSQIYMTISTHSLTRRLTGDSSDRIFHNVISTHSLTRRLTGLFLIVFRKNLFQLTASQGG